MTKAYIVGQLTITNAEGYAKYAAVVPGTVQPMAASTWSAGARSVSLRA
ncbi:MAG: DUF1330 domain-containing protein [Betaproteobacteria bacterium]|nr:DUF1330 domain-containing protein [Betaproteobacteria bacterium]